VRSLTSYLCLALALALPHAAHASDLDISLRGLGVETSTNTAPNERLRKLSAELAFALSPRAVAPARTLGMSGMEFSVDTTIVSFHTGHDYWKGGVTDPKLGSGSVTDAVTEQAQTGKGQPSSMQGVIGFHFRKGLPFSFEVGADVNYLLNSSMFLLGGSVRWGLLEGYHYLPDLSVRGAVGRLMGSNDIDMVTAEVSGTLGKTFGIAGVCTLAPYVGYGLMLVNVNSNVIDFTPSNANDNQAIQRAGGSLYTFDELAIGSNTYNRIFAGLQFHSYIVSITYQFDAGLITKTSLAVPTNTFRLGLDL